jgi:peptidoglycan/xylan/chitin deacetylase (PgdA/CDA1 family)
VRSGPAGRAAVALTFHGSGDLGLTRQLLNQARSLSAPITVFAVGQWLEDNPRLASSILDGGNELANHTYTHPVLGRLGREEVATEIGRCRDALTATAGGPGLWFRPSGTDTPTELMLEEAAKAGYPTVVGYDVDPRDFEDPPASLIASRVADGLHPGAVVSLHTGHAGTVTAFDEIVASVRAAGLQPVLLRDLL